MACWQKLWGTFTSQAEEVRAVVTKVAAAVGEPLKEQVKRSVDDLREANLSGLRPRWEYSHGDQSCSDSKVAGAPIRARAKG
jgi:hypothetical protein